MPLAINHLKFKAMNKTNPFPILSGLLFCILLFMASCKPDTGAEFLYSDQFPELSPDGSMLVYFHWDYQLAESGDYPTGLYIVNLEKNERNIVVEGIHSWTSWAPDNRRFVYVSADGLSIFDLHENSILDYSNTDIFSIDTALINELRLTNVDRLNSNPKWSPDGSTIAFENYSSSSATAIFVMDSDGTNERRLDYGKNPTWSPDSEYIIYSRFNDDMTKELLWKISISDTEKLRLTF